MFYNIDARDNSIWMFDSFKDVLFEWMLSTTNPKWEGYDDWKECLNWEHINDFVDDLSENSYYFDSNDYSKVYSFPDLISSFIYKNAGSLDDVPVTADITDSSKILTCILNIFEQSDESKYWGKLPCSYITYSQEKYLEHEEQIRAILKFVGNTNLKFDWLK